MAMTDEELEAEVRDYNLKRRTEQSEPMIEITAHEAIVLGSRVIREGPLASAVFILDLLKEQFGDDLSDISCNACIWDGDHQFPFDGGLFSIGCGTAATWFILATRNENQLYSDDGEWLGWAADHRVIVFRSEHAARIAFEGCMALNTAWRLSNGNFCDGHFEGCEDDEDEAAA